jgi:hypothetical protein|tara:strand:- start:296 stop:703 length:408 start_codon:yes stop_codon:yes gene_type:complete
MPKRKLAKKEDIILKMISDGITVTSICKGMGISRFTFYKYLNDNQDLKEAYQLARSSYSSEFRSDYEKLLVGAVVGTAKVDVIALKEMGVHSRWLESKCNPEEFGDTSKAMMQLKNGDTEINIAWMTDGTGNDTV